MGRISTSSSKRSSIFLLIGKSYLIVPKHVVVIVIAVSCCLSALDFESLGSALEKKMAFFEVENMVPGEGICG